MNIHVSIPAQRLRLLDDEGQEIRQFICSTSLYGVGTVSGSNKTPTGRFRIAEKHGDGAPLGMIFKERKPIGRFGKETDTEDNVQTRIMWLDGLDPDNGNTKDRTVYIHGTNAESKLGLPVSHGCVRLSNADVVTLYDLVSEGTEVVIENAPIMPPVSVIA